MVGRGGLGCMGIMARDGILDLSCGGGGRPHCVHVLTVFLIDCHLFLTVIVAHLFLS